MRYLMALLFVVVLVGRAYSATITLTIPDEKLVRVTDAIKGLHPIPDEDRDGNPDYTPNAWAKERARQWIRDTVYRWESKQAIIAARDAVEKDDTIAN